MKAAVLPSWTGNTETQKTYAMVSLPNPPGLQEFLSKKSGSARIGITRRAKRYISAALFGWQNSGDSSNEIQLSGTRSSLGIRNLIQTNRENIVG